MNIKIEIRYSNLPLYQILINLKILKLWDQIYPENMNENNFEKILIKTIISI